MVVPLEAIWKQYNTDMLWLFL